MTKLVKYAIMLINKMRRYVMTVKSKPICASPVITGKIAKQVIKEANTTPSKAALLRCTRIVKVAKKMAK